MPTEHLVPEDLRDRYLVREWRNAAGVLQTACPEEWSDIIAVLRGLRVRRSEILTAGGRLSLISQNVNEAFAQRQWVEKKFSTKIVVDGVSMESPTHKVDCFKGRVAFELEWNNKDPFFDRDLNNFRLLFDLRAIDVGVILTRDWELQSLFKDLNKGSSYGNSTTHHQKLWPRVEGGGGGGCPVLTFAITRKLYEDDGPEGLRAAKARITQITLARAADMAAKKAERERKKAERALCKEKETARREAAKAAKRAERDLLGAQKNAGKKITGATGTCNEAPMAQSQEPEKAD